MPASLTTRQICCGIVFSAGSALLWSIMSLFNKLAVAENNAIFFLIFLQNISGLALVSMYIKLSKRQSLFHSQYRTTQFVRSLIGAFGVFLSLYWSIQSLPLSVALTLNTTAPLFVPILLLVICKQSLRFEQLFLITIGFIGVFLIISPSAFEFSIPALAALISGLATAIILLILKKISAVESVLTSVFYYCFFSSLISLINLLALGHIVLSVQFILIGLSMGCCFVIYQYCVYSSLQYISTQLLSTFSYSAIAFSFLFDLLLFQQPLSKEHCAGLILIISSIMLLIWSEYITKKSAKLEASH